MAEPVGRRHPWQTELAEFRKPSAQRGGSFCFIVVGRKWPGRSARCLSSTFTGQLRELEQAAATS